MGISQTMPKGEARPLGTPRPKRVLTVEERDGTRTIVATRTEQRVRQREVDMMPYRQAEEDRGERQGVVDAAPHNIVESHSAISTSKEPTMTLTLKALSKNGKNAMYAGAATILRISLSAFHGKTAPASFAVPDDIFASPRVKKAHLTPEEKAAAKAAKAAAPKPTLAERIARRERLLARDKARLEAQHAEM